MKKLKVTGQTKSNGSSKAGNGEQEAVAEATPIAKVTLKKRSKANNGGKQAPVEASPTIEAAAKPNGSSKNNNGKDHPAAEAAPVEGETKRRGRRAEEGEPLKRLLVFLSEGDIVALKDKAGDKRGVSTKVRAIIKEYLAKA